MNLGALAANVIDLQDRKIKATSIKDAAKPLNIPPRKKHYIIGPFRALEDDRINKSAALPVLMAVCAFTNRSGETWVGQKTIANIFKVSQQSISKHIAKLIEYGYIEIIQKAGKEYSAKMRVVFDPTMTLDEVKSVIPVRLKPEVPPEVILSKEEARERLKKIRNANKVQPQKLCHNPDNIQPQRLCDDDVFIQPNEGVDTTSEVVSATTSGSCEKVNLRIKEGRPLEVWKKKNEEYGFVRNDARDLSANEVIQTWGISQYHIGSLLATMLDELHARNVDPPASLQWFADLGEDMVREMVQGMGE